MSSYRIDRAINRTKSERIRLIKMKEKQHPDQQIQERWNKWLADGEFTSFEKYLEFIVWRDQILKIKH